MIRMVSLGDAVRRVGSDHKWVITDYSTNTDYGEAFVHVSGYDSLNRFSTRTIPFEYFVENWEKFE